jgi:hypothetical protein
MALSYVINQLNKNILFKLLTSYFKYCIFVKEKLKHKNNMENLEFQIKKLGTVTEQNFPDDIDQYVKYFANKILDAISKETAGHIHESENIDDEQVKNFEMWIKRNRKEIFAKLTDDERMDVMSDYCKYCGCDDSGCL